MTWQVIDLRRATVDDLLQSPVLYLCGQARTRCRRTRPGGEQLAQKLRDYLDRGGFLFAEANCGGRAFDKAFRELMEKVFPEPEYRLRLLDPEHPIWHAEEPVAPEQLRPLWGIDFGCRTSVVYAPPDPPDAPRPSLSCLWELSRPGRRRIAVDVSRVGSQAQIDAALVDRDQRAGLRHQPGAAAQGRDSTPVDQGAQERRARPRAAGDRQPASPGRLQRGARALANLLETAGTRAEDPRLRPRAPRSTSPTTRCSTTTWSSCTAGRRSG